MKNARHWWSDIRGRARSLEAGSFAAWSAQDIVCIERGLALIRFLDESHETAFAQVRRGPATAGLEGLHGDQPPFELYAITNIELVEIDVAEATKLVSSLPEPSRQLVAALTASLHTCIDDRITMSGSATARIVRLLLESHHGGDMPLAQMRRHLWAEVLGIRPETLSRELKQLQAAGLIRTSTDRVTVLDEDRLEALLTS